jgi:hypothetical protein
MSSNYKIKFDDNKLLKTTYTEEEQEIDKMEFKEYVFKYFPNMRDLKIFSNSNNKNEIVKIDN